MKSLWQFTLTALVAMTCGAVLPGTSAPYPAQNTPSESGTKPTAGSQTQSGQQGQGPAQARQVTPDEINAIKAIQSELDPDRAIQLAQDFEKKYPDSPYLFTVYTLEANGYEQKNQVDKAIDALEKSLKLKPDNLMSLIMMADLLPTPQDLQNASDAEKDKKLTEAEQDGTKALQLIEQLPKQPNQTDEQLANNKAQLASEVHGAMGMVHLERATMGLQGMDMAELGKAEAEYKLAVAVPNVPPQTFYRLGEVFEHENKIDEAIDAFTKASQAAQGTPIQQLADQQVQRLKQKKAQGQAAVKP